MSELGKVLVHGYREKRKTMIKIYDNDKLVGQVGKDGSWNYKVDEDTYLTFKAYSFDKTNVKVRKDLNNEIFLFYDGYIQAKIDYLTEDFNLEEYNKKIGFNKYRKWQEKQYIKVRLRKIIYIIVFISSMVFYKGTISDILWWVSFFAIIIHSVRYYTKWKQLNGKKVLTLDQVYEEHIMFKLIPQLNYTLNEYGIKMAIEPVSNDPGHQQYSGFDRDDNRLDLKFYIGHVDMRNENNYKYPMLLKYSYKDVFNETIGEIDLSNKKNLERTVNLIVKSLKDKNLIK